MDKNLLFRNNLFIIAAVFLVMPLIYNSCDEVGGFKRAIERTECLNIYPICINEGILISSSKFKYPALVLIDKYTGEDKWTWVDSSRVICDAYYNLEAYYTFNKIALPLGKTIIVLDAKDGKEIFRKKYDAIEAKIDGNCNIVSFVNYNYSPFRVYLSWLDLNTLNLKTFEIPIKIDSTKGARVLGPFVTKEKDSLVAFTCNIITEHSRPISGKLLKIYAEGGRLIEYDMPDQILKYNLTKSFKEYEDNLIGISFNKIFSFSKDYKINWKIELSKPVLSSDFVVDENIGYIAAEDSYVYKIDLQNGKIIDKILTKHLMGRGSKVKDTLFYISDFDNKMYCINTNEMTIINKYSDDKDIVSKVFYKDEEVEIVMLNGVWQITRN